MPPTLLSLQSLHLSHPGVTVFAGLTAGLPAGVGLVCGDEGTGKTSLLRLLAGELAPSAGQLLWDGRPLTHQDVAWFDPGDPRHDALPVRELLPALAGPVAPALLEGLGLTPHLDKPLFQLSTGSRRKVFMAAALSRQAPLTLLDQPFMALDRPSVNFLCECFRAWAGASERLLLLADYQAPEGVPLAGTLDLDRLR